MKRTSRTRWCVRLGQTLLAVGCIGASGEVAWGQTYAPRPATKTAGPATTKGPAAPVSGPSRAPSRVVSDNDVQPTAGEEPIRQPSGTGTTLGAPIGKAPPRNGALNGPAVGGAVGGNKKEALGPAPLGQGQQGPANAPPMAPAPVAPEWVARLTPEHNKYVDEILKFWESRSDSIEQYKCEFVRFEFDPIFGPKDPQTPKTWSTGTIQYGKPDKGLFKIAQIKNYAPPENPEGKPTYEIDKEAIGEHWVCDGKRIFEFDTRAKRVIERPLPPEMHGKAITDGPLPFLFGAKADKIKSRYWIHAITPPNVKGQYWLEAAPKMREDAGNFSKVTIIIDEKEFLPEGIRVYAPNAEKGGGRVEYAFSKREVYGKKSTLQMNLAKLNVFQSEFYEPKVPFGWKKVTDNALLGDVNSPQNGGAQANRSEPLGDGKLPR